MQQPALANLVDRQIKIAESIKHLVVVDAAKSSSYPEIPFVSDVVTRYGSFKLKGREWFENEFAPKISSLTSLAPSLHDRCSVFAGGRIHC